MLSRAQALADRLQADVEAEVAALRADASAAHDEARRLLADASSVHDDALSAQRSAHSRLQEAQEESAQLIADAADQATLVADAAARTSENLVASTQTEAAELRTSILAEALRLQGLATTELEQVRESNAALQAETASNIESQRLQVNAELQQLGEEAAQDAASIRAAAEDFATDARSTSHRRCRRGACCDDTRARASTVRDNRAQIDHRRRDRVRARCRFSGGGSRPG